MPYPPFHLAPGFLLKTIIPKNFSFRIFVLSQFLVDFEALVFLIRNAYPEHGFFHSFLGSTLIALFCVYPGIIICRWATDVWNDTMGSVFKTFRIHRTDISKKAAWISAFFGAYSHVILDGLMHSDTQPFYPDHSNHLHLLISHEQLHLFCLAAGLLGYLIYLLKKAREKTT